MSDNVTRVSLNPDNVVTRTREISKMFLQIVVYSSLFFVGVVTVFAGS